MKPAFDAVIVIPVGPNSSVEFIADTIRSYIHNTRSSYKIIIADDSHQGIGNEVKKIFPDTEILLTLKPMGGWAGLYINLCHAFRHAVRHYHFGVLLKLDTDALVIGPEPEKDALKYFSKHPQTGIIGQYPNDYFGNPWDIGWPRRRITNGIKTWKFIRRPIANLALIKLHRTAVKNGYKTGESVFGGAYFMSEAFLTAMLAAGQLPNYTLRTLNLGEDHLFGLLAHVIGYKLGSFSGKGQPFGCAWKGLPVSPEQLVNDEKKIIHSTRHWKDMNEQDIRTWFKNKREANT